MTPSPERSPSPRVALLLTAAAVGVIMISLAWAEEITLTTYYPAPVGAYRNIRVTQEAYFRSSIFHPHTNQEQGYCVYDGITAPCLATGETKPRPGQLFYNSDNDQFYYSSDRAVAGDRSSWFKPVSGMDNRTVAESLLPGYTAPNNSLNWIKSWAALPQLGSIVSSGAALRMPAQTSHGLYSASFQAEYCTAVGAGGAVGDAPTINLYKRVGLGGWSTIGTLTSVEVDATNLCTEISIETMFLINRGSSNDFGVKFKREKNFVGSLSNARLIVARIMQL